MVRWSAEASSVHRAGGNLFEIAGGCDLTTVTQFKIAGGGHLACGAHSKTAGNGVLPGVMGFLVGVGVVLWGARLVESKFKPKV